MKLPKIQRPEVEIQFVGIKGFFAALQAICKVGLIKKVAVNYETTFTITKHGFEGGTVKRLCFYIIPKFKFKRVLEIDESEGDD